MKYIIGLLAMLLPILSGAQSPPVKALTIGDRVPDIEINNIINYKDSAAKLSDFKDKLVILDFMNTYCLSCIEVLPRFDSLQHQYGDKLQIFIVTNEAKGTVGKFLKTNHVAKNISVPVIVGDTILERLFPHRFVSHEAWINKGIVKAITGSEYVKDENVNKIFAGVIVNWKIKNDNAQYNYRSGLLSLNQDKERYLNGSQKIYYSAFTSHLKDVSPRYSKSVDSNSNMATIRFVNFDIVSLYLYTQTDMTNFPVSHILLESKGKQRLMYLNTAGYHDVWDEDNTFCYEIKFGIKSSAELIKRKISNDLNFYLQTNGRIENRKTNCLLLVRDSNSTNSSLSKIANTTKLEPRNNSEEFRFFSANDIVASLNNNDLFFSTPIFNGIKDSKSIKVTLTKSSLHDKTILDEALKRQGLLLISFTKDVDMLVITDNNLK